MERLPTFANVCPSGKRFTIEETFRDTKNGLLGMGLSSTHIRNEARRDRLIFIAALAHMLLTLLGAAGERCGLDRTLKSNTSKTRRAAACCSLQIAHVRDD